jgi:hypothetical protein
MARLALALALSAAVAVAVSNAESAPDRKAQLTVLKSKPLALRGTGFHPRESVRVTLLASVKRTVRRTTAGPTGTFRVAFPAAANGCSLLVAHAVGSHGSRASARVGRPPCPPPR